MTLQDAIKALNAASKQQILVGTTRDGRVVARLPRTKHEALIEDSTFHPDVKVTARDVALVCAEARLALGPAVDLLDAASSRLQEIEHPAGAVTRGKGRPSNRAAGSRARG